MNHNAPLLRARQRFFIAAMKWLAVVGSLRTVSSRQTAGGRKHVEFCIVPSADCLLHFVNLFPDSLVLTFDKILGNRRNYHYGNVNNSQSRAHDLGHRARPDSDWFYRSGDSGVSNSWPAPFD